MRRIIPVAAAALLTWGVIGCGSNPTGPGNGGLAQQNADDLAVQAVAGLNVLGGEVQVMLGSTPTTAATNQRQAVIARAAWDTTVTGGGITYQASRTFYDALDNELPSYGPLAVRMRWTGRAFGSYEGPRDTASVGHATVLDVRGIQAAQDTVTLDGTCNDTLQVSFRSLDGLRHRWFYWVSGVTVDQVRILKSTFDTGGWPLAGSVTYVVSADRLRSNNRVDVEAHFDATVVVVFNGTSQPVVVVNGAYYYHWNMQTGTLTRA